MKLYPVILSGGSGSRLWPLSREHYPKPLLPLVSDNTLLQETACRLDGMPDLGDAVYVCNETHRFLLAEQVAQLGKTAATIILEPEGRNTAPALTLAALYLVKQDPDAMMVVMPADHVMTEPQQFVAAVEQGSDNAEQGALVTFGIVPESPETGYGYIKRDAPIGSSGAYTVARFVEKPDQQKAEQYVSEGDYYWNSGIFLMRADRWLDEISQHRPDILKNCRAAMNKGIQDSDFFRVDKELFHECPSDSIDYAVMEKTDRAVVVPISAGWSDIGAWPALWNVCPQDADGNVIQGDVLVEDTRNAFLVAQHRCLATVGLDNVVVVETADAVLVASREHAQDVKQVVSQLTSLKHEAADYHKTVHRPWGSYSILEDAEDCKVKRLVVKPGQVLSLQEHYQRSEHWTVIQGVAKVRLGDREFLLKANESTYIPVKTLHRLENPGTEDVHLIEVQTGKYFGEDDIVRYEDIYGRVQQ